MARKTTKVRFRMTAEVGHSVEATHIVRALRGLGLFATSSPGRSRDEMYLLVGESAADAANNLAAKLGMKLHKIGVE